MLVIHRVYRNPGSKRTVQVNHLNLKSEQPKLADIKQMLKMF